MTNSISEGHYAKKQLGSRSKLIAWSHGARFRTGLSLAEQLAGRRLLDYGCGDGTFLAMLMATPHAPSSAVGAEITESVVADCRARHTDPRIAFTHVESLAASEPFDGLFCMEVLEHVLDWNPILDRWRGVVRSGGLIVVSVPVETGPALLFKQAVRRVAGWRGIGDYPGSNPYTWAELGKSMWAGSKQHIERPIHRSGDEPGSHCHKGFNWKRLRGELAKKFVLERTLSSPITRLPPGIGSQVWFVLRNP